MCIIKDQLKPSMGQNLLHHIRMYYVNGKERGCVFHARNGVSRRNVGYFSLFNPLSATFTGHYLHRVDTMAAGSFPLANFLPEHRSIISTHARSLFVEDHQRFT